MAFGINIMLFPGGKKKALTLSYDDGSTQDRRLVEILNGHNVKGTFNLNSGRLGKTNRFIRNGNVIDMSYVSASEVAELYKGHEVSTHTVNHVALTDRGCSALTEIIEDRAALERLVPYMVLGHAHPYGVYDDDAVCALKAAGIRHARTTKSTHGFDLPADFLRWDPTCHHNDPELMELAREFCEGKGIFEFPKVFYLWGHSYEFEMNQNWNVLEDFLGYMDGFKEKIWPATNLEIVNYVSAFKSLVFSADGKRVYNPSNMKIWLESAGETYCIDADSTVSIQS